MSWRLSRDVSCTNGDESDGRWEKTGGFALCVNACAECRFIWMVVCLSFVCLHGTMMSGQCGFHWHMNGAIMGQPIVAVKLEPKQINYFATRATVIGAQERPYEL